MFTYLIDGYNLMHAMGLIGKKVEPGALEKARRQVLEYLDRHWRSRPRQGVVVFDSARVRRDNADDGDYRGLKIHFTRRGEEADDWIESRLAHPGAKERLIVVSNDHRLLDAGRRRGAGSLSCMEFLDQLDEEESAEGKQVEKDSEPHVSPEEAQAWLKEFGDLDEEDAAEWKELFETFDFGELEEEE